VDLRFEQLKLSGGDEWSMRCVFLLIFLVPAFAGPQLQFAFPPFGTTVGFASSNAAYSYSGVVSLPNGDTLLFGSATGLLEGAGLYSSANPHQQIVLAALGPVPFQNGEPPDALPVLGGSGNDVPLTAAVDPSGNIWIAGNTDSDDFNLVNPIVAQKVPYRTAGFILELDPTGTKLLFATYLAGQLRSNTTCPACYYATSISALAVDGSGNVYVGGSTNETDFPTTPGAFMTKGGTVGADSFGNTFVYSFVVKVSPAGKLVYSTLLGTGTSLCSGGSTCIAYESTSATIGGIAVDSTGAVTAAGVKSGGYNLGSGYAVRLSADGSRLLSSTTIGGNYAGVPKLLMALDSSGNVDLFGQYVTAITNPPVPPQAGMPGLFTEKLSSDGSTVLHSTDFGQAPDANPIGIALDKSANAYLEGTSSSIAFLAAADVPNLGSDFVVALDSSGSKVQTLFRFPRGTVAAPLSLDSAGQLLLPGLGGSLLTLPPNYAFDTPVIVGFANSASYAANTGLTAGTLVSLFGFDLGSSQNVQVQVEGFPATVLYAGANQINIQVPFELATVVASGPIFPSIQVVLSSGTVTVAPAPATQAVGIFTSDGIHAAALNQDGSVNSVSNPAVRGSIVTLFGTGAIWPSGTPDGTLATSPSSLDQEQNQFEVVDTTGAPASILYAGTAPGLIDGVFQVNVQLPRDAAPPLTLRASPFGVSLSSNAVQVYLK
jgi:uncharacterized protein (TIGR03437 family)